MALTPEQLDEVVRRGVSHFWNTLSTQSRANESGQRRDQGRRAAVTAGKHLDGLILAVASIIRAAGLPEAEIFRDRGLELPGFYRPTKQWDLLAVADGQVLAVVEVKSIASSFGNNFNNRTEEAVGSAVDLRAAFREGALQPSPDPWIGYVFLLGDTPRSRTGGTVHKEPHFPVMPEWKDAPYLKRGELLCRKLVRDRHYNAAAYITSDPERGLDGGYEEPADDLRFAVFAASLTAHVAAYVAMRRL